MAEERIRLDQIVDGTSITVDAITGKLKSTPLVTGAAGAVLDPIKFFVRPDSAPTPPNGISPDDAATVFWDNAKRFKSIPGNLIYYGGDPAGVADSTGALRAAINAVGPGEKIYVPPGLYRITERVVVNHDRYGIQLVGFAGGCSASTTGMKSQFQVEINDANEFGLDVRTYDFQVRNIIFLCKAGTSIRALLQLRLPTPTAPSTHMTVDQCAFVGGTHGVAIGYETPTGFNMEFCRFRECHFVSQLTSGVIVGQIGTAPANSIGHTFEKCTFYCDAVANGPQGGGLISDGGGPLWFRECNFSGLERAVTVRSAYASSIYIDGSDSENCHCLFDGSGYGRAYGSTNSAFNLAIRGGRLDLSNAQVVTHSPVGLSDNCYIRNVDGGLLLDGVVFNRNGTPADTVVAKGHFNSRLTVRGCTLPSLPSVCFTVSAGGNMSASIDECSYDTGGGVLADTLNGRHIWNNGALLSTHDDALLPWESETVAGIAGPICTGDWDASYGVTGAGVSDKWVDRVRGNKFIPVGTSPVYAVDAGHFNGLAVVQCAITGSKGLYLGTSAAPLAQPLAPKGADYWVIMVARRRASPPAGAARLFEFSVVVNQGLSDEPGGLIARSQASVVTGASGTGEHIFEMGLLAGGLYFYQDGALIGGPAGTGLDTTIDLEYVSLGVNGNPTDGDTAYCNVSIAQFCVFTRRPPASARTRILRLLQGKWGTPAVP